MLYPSTEVFAVYFGQRRAVVTQAYETCDEVVHSAGEDAAKDNPNERCRAELRTHDGTADGTDAGDVQELDEEDAPRRYVWK